MHRKTPSGDNLYRVYSYCLKHGIQNDVGYMKSTLGLGLDKGDTLLLTLIIYITPDFPY